MNRIHTIAQGIIFFMVLFGPFVARACLRF